jgi:predicted NUDIX family NTP pyrophosphohydrolase
MEWPPRSGQQREFPEVDRAGWFELDAARAKILEGQAPLLDGLLERRRPKSVTGPLGTAEPVIPE